MLRLRGDQSRSFGEFVLLGVRGLWWAFSACRGLVVENSPVLRAGSTAVLTGFGGGGLLRRTAAFFILSRSWLGIWSSVFAVSLRKASFGLLEILNRLCVGVTSSSSVSKAARPSPTSGM